MPRGTFGAVERDKIDLTFMRRLTEMAEGSTSTKLGETNSFPTIRTAFWQTLRAPIPAAADWSCRKTPPKTALAW